MVDSNGRIKGRISIVDIIIVLAIVALVVGFVFRQTSDYLGDIINPNDVFYITVEGRELRHFIVDAIEVGDVVFRRHVRQPIGTIVDVQVSPAMDIMQRTDGTAVLAEMEGRYTVHIVIQSTGSIRSTGYFINGNDHVAAGSEIALTSNRVIIAMGRIHSVDRVRPS